MTRTEFENEVVKVGQPLVITDQTIVSEVNLRNVTIIATGVLIENCIFENAVTFKESDLNCGIVFKNCIFKDNLYIVQCIASNYDNEFNVDNSHLVFSNTTIGGLYFSGVNKIQRGVFIKESSIINTLQVRTIISSMGSFRIKDSTVNNQFDISQAKLRNGFSISGRSSINAKMRFENIEVDSFVFTDATFNKDIHIWAGSIKRLLFNDGLFKDNLSITAVPITESLTIIGSEFKKSITFKLIDETNEKQGELNKIHLSSAKFGEQFIINGNYNKIENLVINMSKKLEGALYFNSTNILKTEISGDNYNSNIVFNHCNFNELNFDFFYNYSTLSIISAKSFGEDSSLTIAHSNVGKLHLFNVFLDTFHKINIYNSVLTDIIAANVKWFDDSKLNPNLSIPHHTFKQRKEIYRQLKYALEKQGNRISSLNFKALEMKSYKQELFVKVKWFQRILNTDRFVLWLGQTNDFGLNWLKPVVFAIIFSILFHFLIVLGVSDELAYSPHLSWQSMKTTCSIYKENLSTLPQLMNPAHVLSRIYPGITDFSLTVHLLDYLFKLILAFFIFQTISAFRKYSK